MNFYNYPDVGLKYSPDKMVGSGQLFLASTGASYESNNCTVYTRGVTCDPSQWTSALCTVTADVYNNSSSCGELILVQNLYNPDAMLCGDYLTSFCIYNSSNAEMQFTFYIFRHNHYDMYGGSVTGAMVTPVYKCTFTKPANNTGWYQVTGLCAKIRALDIMGLGVYNSSYWWQSCGGEIPVVMLCDSSTTGINYVCSLWSQLGECSWWGDFSRVNVHEDCYGCFCGNMSLRSSVVLCTQGYNSCLYPLIRATTHTKVVSTSNSIKHFYGGDSTPSLSDYYHGGSFVDDASKPSSGTIKVSDFYGSGGGGDISFANVSLSTIWKSMCRDWINLYNSYNFTASPRNELSIQCNCTSHSFDLGICYNHTCWNRYNAVRGLGPYARTWDGWCLDGHSNCWHLNFGGFDSPQNDGFQVLAPSLDRPNHYPGGSGWDCAGSGSYQSTPHRGYWGGIVWQPKSTVCPILIGKCHASDCMHPVYRQISVAHNFNESSMFGLCCNWTYRITNTGCYASSTGGCMRNFLSWDECTNFVSTGSNAVPCVHVINYCGETLCYVIFAGESTDMPPNYGSVESTRYPVSLIIKVSKASMLGVHSCNYFMGNCSHTATGGIGSNGRYAPEWGRERCIYNNYNHLGCCPPTMLHCGQCIFTHAIHNGFFNCYTMSVQRMFAVHHSPEWNPALCNSTHGYLKTSGGNTLPQFAEIASNSQGCWNCCIDNTQYYICGGQMTDSGSADYSSSNYSCNFIVVHNFWYMTSCMAGSGGNKSQTICNIVLNRLNTNSALSCQAKLIADNGAF